MKAIIFLFFLFSHFICFAQDNNLINSGSISAKVNCGVGEIFVNTIGGEVGKNNITSKDDIVSKNDITSKDDVVSKNDNNVKTKNNTILIYPNPVEDKIYIESLLVDLHDIYIFDMSGKLIMINSLQKSTEIDVSMLESGTYLLMSIDFTFNPVKFIKK